MKYETPQVVVLATAIEAVQATGKPLAQALDSDGSGNRNGTSPAYEADE